MAFGYHFYMQVEGSDRAPQHYTTRAALMDYYTGLMDGAGLFGQERKELDADVMEQGVGDGINLSFSLPDGRTVRYWSEGRK